MEELVSILGHFILRRLLIFPLHKFYILWFSLNCFGIAKASIIKKKMTVDRLTCGRWEVFSWYLFFVYNLLQFFFCSINFKTRQAVLLNEIIMLKFEIVSSRTVEGAESEKKFVAYMLQVRQDNNESRLFDPDPANVERRYTHFLDLYNGLKKDHASLLGGIAFPRKVCWNIVD